MNKNKSALLIKESDNPDRVEIFKVKFNLRELNTSKEAAEALRVSDFTMRLSRSTGELLGAESPRHVNYGRSVRYYAKDLMEWVNDMNNLNTASYK